MSELPDRLRAALPAAMKRGDRPAVTAIRTALAAIDNAGAVDAASAGETAPGDEVEGATAEGPVAGSRPGLFAGEVARRELSDRDVAAIVAGEVRERRIAAEAFESAGRSEAADRLRAEAAALDAVLRAVADG